MSLNLVVLDGVASHVALRYDEHSKPELRFTLTQTEKDWPLYLPCFSPGAAGERLAAEIEEGQHVVVTSGKLTYRKRDTKAGPQSRLEILVWSIDRLSQANHLTTSGEAEPMLRLRRSRCLQRRAEPLDAVAIPKRRLRVVFSPISATAGRWRGSSKWRCNTSFGG
jgi:hypothetical protein